MTLNVYCAPYEGKQDELAERIDAAWRIARGEDFAQQRLRTRCSTFVPRARRASPFAAGRRLLTSRFVCAPGRIRTCGTRSRNPIESLCVVAL
jgi:hypothetical protein